MGVAAAAEVEVADDLRHAIRFPYPHVNNCEKIHAPCRTSGWRSVHADSVSHFAVHTPEELPLVLIIPDRQASAFFRSVTSPFDHCADGCGGQRERPWAL